MAQEKLNGPVCLNHPDKLAVAHCCVCRRPVCKDCLIQDNGFKCCSRECLKMAKESTQRTADVLERKARSDAGAWVRPAIRLVVLAALIVAAWFFRGNIQGLYNKYFGKGKPTVKQRIEEYNRQNVEKDHQRRNKKMNDFERDGL
ncbi:MAG: B-box zinc finger protein [Oligosphaeraceae bacterium]